MRKLVVCLLALMIGFSASAQLKSVEVIHDADTLIYMSQTFSDAIRLYKNPKGYLLKIDSSNMFDSTPFFYLGKTKESAIQTLQDLARLCDNDVATKVILRDSEDNLFVGFTTNGYSSQRKPTYIKSNCLHLKNENMAGTIQLFEKQAQTIISFLNGEKR